MNKLLMVLLLIVAFLPRPAAALATDELLALVAMPLAVAAVSEVTDVPANELVDFISLLNQADVPPTQFVEVVRYVPVALVVTTDEPNFVEFVRTRTQTGVSGNTLVTVIRDRFRTVYSMPEADYDTTASQTLFEQRDFIPPVVRTRIAYVKQHPHGGPPGQLKKQRGLQTGAEVVHRDRVRDDDVRLRTSTPAVKPKKKDRDRDREVIHVRGPVAVETVVRVERAKGNDKGHGDGGGKDKGGKDKGGKGNGKGKGQN